MGQISSFAQPCLTLCNPIDCSTADLPVHHQLRVYSNSRLSSWWCHLSHLILCCLLILPHSIFPSIRVFSNDSSLHQVAIQHKSFQWIFRTDFLQEWLIGPAWSPRDSPEPSPTPQFKSINSSALSFLYSPTLTSIHDYWKNHSFD